MLAITSRLMVKYRPLDPMPAWCENRPMEFENPIGRLFGMSARKCDADSF
jgi:hypothetical protein